MILRKPALLAASTSLQSLTSQSSTSSVRWNRGTRPPQQQCSNNRYATVAGDSRGHSEHPDPREPGERQNKPHAWPQTLPGQVCPTPYQIFAMKHDGAYSKARFYELVKLYHPDLTSGPGEATSHATKVERYRLIVAAHAILSDPVKRNAYDRFGAGWNGRAEFSMPQDNARSPGPFTSSDPSDPIWQNATWEDWERFHARRAGERHGDRAPLYMSNTSFLAVVVALAMIGGSMNYGRAQDAGHYFVEQRDIIHDRSAKDLRKVRQELSSLQSRQDRIDYFVRQREATMGSSGYDEALREERASRLLPDGEVCSSEEIRERDP